MTKDEKKKKSRLQKRFEEMRANHESIYDRHPELRELEKERRKRK